MGNVIRGDFPRKKEVDPEQQKKSPQEKASPSGTSEPINLLTPESQAWLLKINPDKAKSIVNFELQLRPLNPETRATAEEYLKDLNAEGLIDYINKANPFLINKNPTIYIVALQKLTIFKQEVE